MWKPRHGTSCSCPRENLVNRSNQNRGEETPGLQSFPPLVVSVSVSSFEVPASFFLWRQVLECKAGALYLWFDKEESHGKAEFKSKKTAEISAIAKPGGPRYLATSVWSHARSMFRKEMCV
ncbi:hypothetical protein CBR_g37643 [Chara braunii]|uniref:Uncharacterized protein n=1 Tax=Chara braunii TaxID=69332 RepID=A0A388LNH2_CHABU|nr:hypothetical protein CBR_g37643 [Chara braunii]|eukprot:GBG83844.1 hypothetical protein CBR_g37643 [Chara braunii]